MGDNYRNILGDNSADNVFVSDLVAANPDGSIIERQESLRQQILALPTCIEKSDGNVLSGADALFTITGGPILIKYIFGIVTTVIGGAANGTLQVVTTSPATTTALSTTVAIDSDAVGTSYAFIGATGVLTPTTAGALLIDPVTVAQCEMFVPTGTINFLGSAARTGVIKWYMHYVPLSPNSVVTVAS